MFSPGGWFESAFERRDRSGAHESDPDRPTQIEKLMMAFRTLATVRHHGMELTDYEFSVPLNHDEPSGETLSIFARAVSNSVAASAKRPWLVFLQGGPGFPGPRPLEKSGWLKRALDDYQVLLLDSRGNGRSSVVLPQTLARRGNARAQADYLMH